MYDKYIKSLFLTLRFYIAFGAAAFIFISAFVWEPVMIAGRIVFVGLCILALLDYLLLYVGVPNPVAERRLSEKLSNGIDHIVAVKVVNRARFPLTIELLDQLPFQFEERDFIMQKTIAGGKSEMFRYRIRPVTRGDYQFGELLLFVRTRIGLLKRRIPAGKEESVQVLPAFNDLSKYSLQAEHTLNEQGGGRIRRLGSSLEFEQIKDYFSGDDVRTINWKATARKGVLMVNHYMAERSQQVYCIIDKGRLMRMPFDSVSLLDYAVNAVLALSYTSLKKQDKAGLFTFSDKAGSFVAADRKIGQQQLIMQQLYREQTEFKEADFELLYLNVRKLIRQRSLLVLFTNFESLTGLKRQLPYLRAISRHHMLLVVFFENTELIDLASAPADDLEKVYTKTIAGKFVTEKRLIVRELNQAGIQALLTTPKQLTVQAVNRYLELKRSQAF